MTISKLETRKINKTSQITLHENTHNDPLQRSSHNMKVFHWSTTHSPPFDNLSDQATYLFTLCVSANHIAQIFGGKVNDVEK